MRRLLIFLGLSLLISLPWSAQTAEAQGGLVGTVIEPALPAEEETPAEIQAAEAPGALVTLDFEDADIRDVIKVIALASGMNMVIGEDVQAKVTISLKDVPWEKALDIILRTYNISYKKEANLIRIMTFEKVKQEERDIPLMTKIIYLNFASVSDMQTTLANMLSERGSINIDERTNSMLITDIPPKVEEAERVAKELDTCTPQVLIEAMLVDVKLTKDDELGINWNIFDYAGGDENQVGTTPADGGERDFMKFFDGLNTVTGSAKFGWVQRLGQYRVEGMIKAWLNDSRANILASPKVITLDNKTATISIKSQVAYTQSTSSDAGGTTTSTQFKDVTTGLEVTPHITKEGFVSMRVIPRQEFVEGWVSGQPQIGSRSAETNVLVKDGETIVIGGLRKIEDSTAIQKVPILGDIPILGSFFRVKEVQKINTELVMFVTPRIITHPDLTEEDHDRYEMLEQERETFLEQWQKEKEKAEKKRQKKQEARLKKLTAAEEEFILEEPCLELEEPLVCPEIPEEDLEYTPDAAVDLEDNEYIYSW